MAEADILALLDELLQKDLIKRLSRLARGRRRCPSRERRRVRSCVARCARAAGPMYRCAAPACDPPSSPVTHPHRPHRDVARGDVLTFVLDDAVVTHRVIWLYRAPRSSVVATTVSSPIRPCRARPSSAGRGGRRPRAAGWGAAGAGAGGCTPRVTGARMRAGRVLQESGLLLRQVCRRPPPRHGADRRRHT